MARELPTPFMHVHDGASGQDDVYFSLLDLRAVVRDQDRVTVHLRDGVALPMTCTSVKAAKELHQTVSNKWRNVWGAWREEGAIR